jgi:hypothetical protein
MNDKLTAVTPLLLDAFEIRVVDDALHISGVISLRDPTATISPYFAQVHRAVVASGAKQLRIDITKLRFMNSSAIRSLVDWVEWILSEPQANRYELQFVMASDAKWQATILSAIQTFGGAHVVVLRG